MQRPDAWVTTKVKIALLTRGSRTKATDDQIKEHVSAALKADPALADSSIYRAVGKRGRRAARRQGDDVHGGLPRRGRRYQRGRGAPRGK